jgi:hypothetical protein
MHAIQCSVACARPIGIASAYVRLRCHQFNEIKVAIVLSSFDVEQQLSQHQTAAPEGVWCTHLCVVSRKVEHLSGHCRIQAIVLLMVSLQFLIPQWPSCSFIVQI